MTLVEPKPSPRPWFALWRREGGTFAQLPLVARGLFNEILKLTDDDGVIDIGDREPSDAIAWALGADRGDRRALAKCVPLLLADGCLEHRGALLVAVNFERWQPRTKTERRSRTSNEPTTNEQRTHHEPTTNPPRTDHETGAKPAEPLHIDPHSRVEKRREEERTPKPPNISPSNPTRRDPMLAVSNRPDVLEVHAAWKLACDFPRHRFRGAYDTDAGILADAIEAHGLAECLLVAEHAPNDGMVSGKRDERGTKHDTIRYIFGNPDTFARIQRAAQEALGRSSRKRSASEVAAEAKLL